MEVPNDKKDYSPKNYFDDLIGNPLAAAILAKKLNNEELKKILLNELNHAISKCREDRRILKMSYFTQVLDQMEDAINNSSESEVVDKLNEIWNDLVSKTKKAGIV